MYLHLTRLDTYEIIFYTLLFKHIIKTKVKGLLNFHLTSDLDEEIYVEQPPSDVIFIDPICSQAILSLKW